MAKAVEKLNDILADERICIDRLHRAKSKCLDGGRGDLIDRILASCLEICGILEDTIRRRGGEPTAFPASGRKQFVPEGSLSEILLSIEAMQREIIREINLIVESPVLADVHDALLAIRQFHIDGAHWLSEALGQDEERA